MSEFIKYSFLITTYNRVNLLEEAVKSILQNINDNFEIIIIDDNSHDNTQDFIMNFTKNYTNITYIKQNVNMGPSHNRKIAFELSRGKYVIFMDDDDFYIKTDFTIKVEEIFNNYNNLSFVSGQALQGKKIGEVEIFKPLNVKGFISGSEYFKKLQIKYDKPKSTFTTVFSKEKLVEAKVQELNMFNDSSIFLKALSVGDTYILDDIWGLYRLHDSNISKSLSSEFIISNLEEKINLAKNNENIISEREINRWIFQHFKMTINYFVQGKTEIKIIDFKRWLNTQTKINMIKMIVFLLFIKFKLAVKRILRLYDKR